MTITNIAPVVLPQATMVSAIRRLHAARLDASILQPDEGPAQIAVSYFPRRRESAMQAFMSSVHDTSYFRMWAAADGTVRVTSDEWNEERVYSDIDGAVKSLVAITTKPGRA